MTSQDASLLCGELEASPVSPPNWAGLARALYIGKALQAGPNWLVEIKLMLPVTTMDDDGEQRDLTFGDLEAYTREPYTDVQLFLAMMTAVGKFSPRYAKVVIII